MPPTPAATQIPAERRRYEVVVDRLLELIEVRGLRPGDALPTERELAEAFSVSRNVLRQSFGVLEERGLLVTRRGSGRYLREAPGGSQDGDARSRVEIASIADVLEARSMLEVPIAVLACERRTADEADSLRHVAARLSGWEDNVAFHSALAACTHNFMLERMVREQIDLAGELHQREHYKDADQLKQMRREHIAIADAVSARDGESAAELVTRHLKGTGQLLYRLALSDDA